MAAAMTREQVLRGVALWIEKTHGRRGPEHIAKQIVRLANAGDEVGIAMWQAVADRYDLPCEWKLTSIPQGKPTLYAALHIR